MQFKDFLFLCENKMAYTKDILDALSKTITYLLPGKWEIIDSSRKMPAWTMQAYFVTRTEGKSVINAGDRFEVVVFVYVYKRPKEEFQGINVYDPPAWVEDETQWEDVSQYDLNTGHPLIEFSLLVRVPSSPEREVYPFPSDWYPIFDDRNMRFKTPYEVISKAREIIENWRGFNDKGDEPDEPLKPAPKPQVPVGV